MVEEIIPEIEKLEFDDEKSKEHVQCVAAERHILSIIKARQYASYDNDYLLEAFRALDSDKSGYIDLHTLFRTFQQFGEKFIKEQISEMESYCVQNEVDILDQMPFVTIENEKIQMKHTQYTSRKFYYENYLRKSIEESRRHFNGLLEEFIAFKEAMLEERRKAELRGDFDFVEKKEKKKKPAKKKP